MVRAPLDEYSESVALFSERRQRCTQALAVRPFLAAENILTQKFMLVYLSPHLIY